MAASFVGDQNSEAWEPPYAKTKFEYHFRSDSRNWKATEKTFTSVRTFGVTLQHCVFENECGIPT